MDEKYRVQSIAHTQTGATLQFGYDSDERLTSYEWRKTNEYGHQSSTPHSRLSCADSRHAATNRTQSYVLRKYRIYSMTVINGGGKGSDLNVQHTIPMCVEGLGASPFTSSLAQYMVFLRYSSSPSMTLSAYTINMKSVRRQLALAAICTFTLLGSGCFVSEAIYVTPGNRTAAISETDIRDIKEICDQVAKEFGMLPAPASEIEAQEARLRSVVKGARAITSYVFPNGDFAMGAASAPQTKNSPALVTIGVGVCSKHIQIERRMEELLNERLGPGRAKLRWKVYANFA